MEITSVIFLSIIIFAAGFALAFWLRTRETASKIRAADDDARKIIADAQKESDTIRKEAKLHAKDQLYQMKVEFERETKDVRSELKSQQKRFVAKPRAQRKLARSFVGHSQQVKRVGVNEVGKNSRGLFGGLRPPNNPLRKFNCVTPVRKTLLDQCEVL